MYHLVKKLVNKWVKTMTHDNISQMNSNDIVDNLNNIRTVSIQVQTFVSQYLKKRFMKFALKLLII